MSPSQLTHASPFRRLTSATGVRVFVGLSLYRPDWLNHWTQGPALSLAPTLSLEVRLISCGSKPGPFKSLVGLSGVASFHPVSSHYHKLSEPMGNNRDTPVPWEIPRIWGICHYTVVSHWWQHVSRAHSTLNVMIRFWKEHTMISEEVVLHGTFHHE